MHRSDAARPARLALEAAPAGPTLLEDLEQDHYYKPASPW